MKVCVKCKREIMEGEKWTITKEGVIHWPECPKATESSGSKQESGSESDEPSNDVEERRVIRLPGRF